MFSTLFSLVTVLIIVSLSKSVLSSSTTTGFACDLIHRDSVNSPLFNPFDTHHDRLHASINRSHARFNILQQKISSNGRVNPQTSFEFNLTTSNFEYLMIINIGTPSKNIAAIIDTGSDVIWTHCGSCQECTKQDAPVFNPKQSSTFSELDCNSASCHLLDSDERNCRKEHDGCRYKLWYGDLSLVYGLLANETFAFNTSDGRHMQIRDVIFGCSDISNGTFNMHTGGIVGLGGGPLSLVSQLGPLFGYKFSYCFAPYTTHGASGKLKFGMDNIFSSPHVESTPLIKTPLLPSTFFTVRLAGVKVGDMELESGGTNIILDSGTTLTYLDRKLVQPIVEKVKKMIHLQTAKDPNFDLCFKTGLNSSKVEYPDIILKLGTVNIKLGPEKGFFHLDDKVCLNIVSNPTGFQILGNIAQQNFLVGYNLHEQMVYFASTDCTRL